MILSASAILLLAAFYAYGKGSKWIPLVTLLPYLGLGVYLATVLILPWAAPAYWAIVGIGAGLPLLTLAVVAADSRWGLFCLDTFFGIAFVVFLSPVLLLGNAAAVLARAWGG